MKIGLLGYGKMGKAIEALVLRDGTHEISWKTGSDGAEDIVKNRLREADVIIEFTRPEKAFDHLLAAIAVKVPIVTGTTGWLDKLPEVKRACEAAGSSVFHAPNFSIGVNLFFALNQWMARQMANFPGYAPSLREIHHTEKLDSPSGTGIFLANQILAARSDKLRWVNAPTSDPAALELLSSREDEVPGTHEVVYASAVDRIELKHEALSREGFAEGALSAALWLTDSTAKRKGVYTMKDMLS